MEEAPPPAPEENQNQEAPQDQEPQSSETEVQTPEPTPAPEPQAQTAEEALEAILDKIMQILTKRSSIKLSELSKELNIDKKLVEEYCEILAENGMIKMKQLPLGETILIRKRLIQ